MESDDRTSLQLSSVTLERFKAAFKPAPIPLQPFTVLVGRNGSGKSTLLEALQWLDTTIRQDARVACDRYLGVHDLMNLRSRATTPYFQLTLKWIEPQQEPSAPIELEYRVKVEEVSDGITPLIAEEELTVHAQPARLQIIGSSPEAGKRYIYPNHSAEAVLFDEPDRLALGRATRSTFDAIGEGGRYLDTLQRFWSRAVFLRLSPNRLAQGSTARRRSYDPFLDEEGQILPALLRELSRVQVDDLVAAVQEHLPDIQDIDVPDPKSGRNEVVYYALKEKIRGRTGRSLVSIPAWMLSEGTRRITAILALLQHDPPPSLICIEEIENGLDPWTVVKLLGQLQSAASRGIQILTTTHSPWFLDHVPVQAIIQATRTEGDTVYERFSDREDVRRYISRLPPGTLYVTGGP